MLHSTVGEVRLAEAGGMKAEGSRREERHLFKLSALIGRGGRFQPASILNFSSSGMLIESSSTLLVGQKFQIVCGKIRPIECRVIWAREGRAGLQLTQPISLHEFELATASLEA